MSDYQTFLKQKEFTVIPTGIENPKPINPYLFPYQRDIVTWALKKGRAAIFSSCGSGKSIMQIEWAKHVHEHTQGDILILAPLAVNLQTVEEGKKIGVEINHARKQSDVKPGLNITNYEMMHHFDASHFTGIVIDESGILKSFDGKYRNMIIESFHHTPFKLACTATPSPNDFMELGNHAQFLGLMSVPEMLATFFVHDGGETSKWRLKGHADKEFWKWIAKWAVMIQKPSDLGYSDDGFILPELTINQHTVEAQPINGMLFAFEANTLQERQKARASSIDERVKLCADIVNSTDESFLVWCNLNEESDKVTRAIPGAVEVKGSDSTEHKEKSMLDFAHGKIRVLISKPSICGFGLNFQVCHRMAFLGLSDSFEQYYQAVRRCWRFGQTKPVSVDIITSELEGAVVRNIQLKEERFEIMVKGITENMKEEMNREVHGATQKESDEYKIDENSGMNFELKLGDCVEMMKEIADNSIHYSIFSPPFSSLYTFSNSERDMSNCRSVDQFMEHMTFLMKELFRVIKPGRLLSFHCVNLPCTKNFNGYIGIRDFRGELIRAFEQAGFYFHSEVCIWKDPVVSMQRTKAIGLLYKQLKKDSNLSRQGIPDYLVTMRKPGDNPEPITKTESGFPLDLWQNYASPVWMDIKPSDTLNYKSARENEDERHITPLQLEVIRRALKLWTNPNDLILTPFAGIGSELVVSLEEGRRAVGIELKQSYYDQAVKNCHLAEKHKAMQLPLFELEGV